MRAPVAEIVLRAHGCEILRRFAAPVVGQRRSKLVHPGWQASRGERRAAGTPDVPRFWGVQGDEAAGTWGAAIGEYRRAGHGLRAPPPVILARVVPVRRVRPVAQYFSA